MMLRKKCKKTCAQDRIDLLRARSAMTTPSTHTSISTATPSTKFHPRVSAWWSDASSRVFVEHARITFTHGATRAQSPSRCASKLHVPAQANGWRTAWTLAFRIMRMSLALVAHNVEQEAPRLLAQPRHRRFDILALRK